MKVLLNIEKSRADFFMELIKSLDYVRVIKEVKDKHKSEFIDNLKESFEDVKLHEQGKKKLKTGKELLDEL